MTHTNYRETLLFLGGLTIKPFIIIILFFVPDSLKKLYLIPLIAYISKINWKIGYVLTLYLNQYIKGIFRGEKFVVSKTRFGYYLKVPVSDNHFLWRSVGLYHPEKLLKAVEHEIKGCSHICEVGTHLGELSAWFKKLLPTVKFTAFELHPEFVDYVRDSFELNQFSNYHINNAIVGLRPIYTKGYCDFESLVEAFPELHVGASLEDKFFTEDISTTSYTEIPLTEKQVINAIDLSQYFINEPPDFYFMDIEGCEIYALPMIIQLNKKFNIKAKIVFEIHHYAYSGEQAFKIKQLLNDNGYSMYSIDSRHLFCV